MVVVAHEGVAAASPQQLAPRVPRRRGALSDATLRLLVDSPNEVSERRLRALATRVSGPVLADRDAQLTLWCLYELQYRGLAHVDERWEWSPAVLTLRGALEASFEAELRRAVGDLPRTFADVSRETGLVEAFEAVDLALPGPGASRYVRRSASLAQWQELLVSKSIYQLKEADPHSWAIPRLAGDAKTALVEIQYDEYGAGRRGRQHSQLFAETMRLCGLDPGYAAYLDAVPVSVLALNNLMTMLGLHRRLLAGVVGHLALYESTSCLPNKHYAVAARRLGVPADAVTYFDEHVEADAIHEQVAVVNMLGAHLRDHPDDAEVAGFGVAAGALLDNELARQQLACWRAGRPFLLERVA
jgi:hypothetical protein